MQGTLFDDGVFAPEPLPEIEGLVHRAGYIDAAEERALLDAIDAMPWRSDWERRTQHYGYSYAPGGSRHAPPVPLGPLPAWLAPLAERLATDGFFARPAQNVVINEYLPGQGIAPHVDLPQYGPTVAIVSLAAPILLDLVHRGRDLAQHVWLEPRSLLVLGGPARAEWMHGIARRRSDVWAGTRRPRERRVSVTFRTVL